MASIASTPSLAAGAAVAMMKKGKVVCPHGMDPQVIKAADQQYNEFNDMQAKHSNKPKGHGKKIIDYKNLGEKSKKKIRKTILAMMAEDYSREKATMAVITACTSTPAPGPAVFMLSTLPIPVFNITLPPRHMLPIPIHTALLQMVVLSLLDVPIALQSAVLWTLLLPS
jgi:hypothetical protein